MPYLDKNKQRECERRRYEKRKALLKGEKQTQKPDLFSGKYVRDNVCPITGFVVGERRTVAIDS